MNRTIDYVEISVVNELKPNEKENRIANERNDPFPTRTIALILSALSNQTIIIECGLSRIDYAECESNE